MEHSYAALPDRFFATATPQPASAPKVVVVNHAVAQTLGLDLADLSEKDQAKLFTGQQLPGAAQPIAQAYAGHQFGGFTMLGDGRALLLGEQITPSGRRFDIQFKGSGRTAFSRRGDGKAALGPMLREHIISEAMHALGVPTTRSLAVALTGDTVYRETALAGAVLTRVAASHLRVGTFQYAAAAQHEASLRQLADYAIARHDPQLVDAEDKYTAWLEAFIDRQAQLVAQWQAVGFIHGVLNTDNVTIGGETIDYGPCAFMDAYDPKTVFSSIDQDGRYAYGNQPVITQWNLARFAETLLPLIDADPDTAVMKATERLEAYPDVFDGYWLQAFRGKLGFATAKASDKALIDGLLAWMQGAGADFTNTFDDLTTGAVERDPFYAQAGFADWHASWRDRIQAEGGSFTAARAVMRRENPAVVPRNHQVERALAAAVGAGDYAVMHELLRVLADPYRSAVGEAAAYREPGPGDSDYQTFCGT